MISTLVMTLQSVDEDGNNAENPNLAFLESICISWFTLEFLLRYASPGYSKNILPNENLDLPPVPVNGSF